MDPSDTFNPTERAREKQASRDEDARAIASGEKTVEQVRRENGAFAFPRDRVKLTFPANERKHPPKTGPSMSTTKVVNIRRDAAEVKQAVRDGRYTYIGRGMGSLWGNPFTWKTGTQADFLVPKDECLTRYEAWIRQQPDLMAKLPDLRGRILGCFCKPAPCHGDILVRLIEELDIKG